MKGFEVQIGRVHRAGLEVCDFAVKLDQAHENHDHDMEYLHGHSEYRSKEKERVLESQITQHKHVHEHRSLQEILHIIEHADAAQGAKELAKKIFRILAVAVCLENLHDMPQSHCPMYCQGGNTGRYLRWQERLPDQSGIGRKYPSLLHSGQH